MSKFIDLTGKRFGRLIVLRYVDKDRWRSSRWLCSCDCGKEKIIIGQSLKSGATKSCGCLHIEKTIERFTKHGHVKNGKISKTYIIWDSMISRCINPNNISYKNYGGRGITICKSWSKFGNFLEDMDEVPKKHQIDRINNNGNYCKDNCKWSTRTEQGRNKRNNHLITYNGKTQCISAWAEEFGINRSTLMNRLSRGWSIEKALTTPVGKYKKGEN